MDIPVYSLDAMQAVVTLQTPIAHKDPFDELLLTVAQSHKMALFTSDSDLAGHPLAFIAA